MAGPPYTPRNPDYERRVRESWGRQVVMATFGAELRRLAPGEVEIALPFRADLTQQHGFLHAGIVTTIADSACGFAAFSLMPADAGVLAVEFKVNLMAPAIGEEIVARAGVLREGRTISVTQAHVWALRDGEEKRIATMLGTIMTVRDRPDVQG